jgi:hypothetical protein
MTRDPPDGGDTSADPGPLRPLAEVVEGYTDLAGWLTSEIGGHARAMAARLDAGEYTPDLAVRDAARSMALAATASIRMVNEAVDAMVLLARPPKPTNIVEVTAELPRPFKVPCQLEIEDGVLRSKFDPPDVIEQERVTLSPNPLPAGKVTFVVKVDASRRRAAGYLGRVVATPTRGKGKPQFVDVRVPVR